MTTYLQQPRPRVEIYCDPDKYQELTDDRTWHSHDVPEYVYIQPKVPCLWDGKWIPTSRYK